MRGTKNLSKKYFFTQFEIVLNFQYFCKVRACWISVKNSIFQKLPKIVEKHFFWWKEQIILPKNIFLAQFEIVLNFHYFCKVWPVEFSVKNSNFQKLPKIVEKHFFWWKEQIILPKNIFLAQFWDSTKFSLFLQGPRLLNFRQKFKISKNCLKLWRNTSFDERNK